MKACRSKAVCALILISACVIGYCCGGEVFTARPFGDNFFNIPADSTYHYVYWVNTFGYDLYVRKVKILFYHNIDAYSTGSIFRLVSEKSGIDYLDYWTNKEDTEEIDFSPSYVLIRNGEKIGFDEIAVGADIRTGVFIWYTKGP